jgi:glyoxylase-like metal-dependent hydrolase (beta-lactamase superfamily II)
MGEAAVARLTVGDAQIHRVEESRRQFPLSMLTTDESLIEGCAGWLFPRFADADRNFDMVFQSWIMVVDGKVVVVDPCVGNGRNLPTLPFFHMLDTPFIERFAATGFRPEDVDYVFCTHLHSDHCGWNTQLRGGRFVPTFPNARYIMVRREYDRWDPRRPGHHPSEHNAGVFEASVLPVLEAGLAELVADTHRISPSLLIEPAWGHTAGHSALHLSSAGEEACFTGDVFHHPLELVHPELDARSCEDFAQTLATRRRLIARCLATGALIVPAHFAAPYVGFVREENGAVIFEPHQPEGWA